MVHADYAPDPTQGAAWAERAFGAGTAPSDDGGLIRGLKLSETESTSDA